MDFWVGIVGLATAVLGLLARFDPRLTADGRRQASIGRDIELLGSMPEGAAQARLREHVVAAVEEMLAERDRDKTQDRLTWLLLFLAGIGLLAVAVLDEVPTETTSDQVVYLALVGVVLGCTLLAPLFVAAVLWQSTRRAAGRRRDRRAAAAMDAELAASMASEEQAPLT